MLKMVFAQVFVHPFICWTRNVNTRRTILIEWIINYIYRSNCNWNEAIAYYENWDKMLNIRALTSSLRSLVTEGRKTTSSLLGTLHCRYTLHPFIVYRCFYSLINSKHKKDFGVTVVWCGMSAFWRLARLFGIFLEVMDPIPTTLTSL